MNKVMRTSLTIVMATVMIGLAVSQARADRVSFAADRCFGVGCIGGSVRVGELSLAFTESSLGVMNTASSATTFDSFPSELDRTSGLNFAGSKAAASEDPTTASKVTRNKDNTPTLLLPGSGMFFASSRLAMPGTALSVDLGRSITANSGSFSVSGVALNANKTSVPYWSADANRANEKEPEFAPGGAPVPEPTTMLLLGTGLAGAAAIVRKRLRTSRP